MDQHGRMDSFLPVWRKSANGASMPLSSRLDFRMKSRAMSLGFGGYGFDPIGEFVARSILERARRDAREDPKFSERRF
jgi:hypothetical protein